MANLKRMGMGILVAALAIGISLIGQLYSTTFAANTLPGNNEIITIGGTTDGQPINATPYVQAYSGDGNVLLFTSTATNLPNAGGSGGLYTYNIKTATIARVDISTNGTLPNGALGGYYRLSETGRYTLFVSNASNLIDGATEPQRQIYKRDTQTGATTWVASGYTGGLSQNWDHTLGLSNDGRFALVASRYISNNYPYYYGVVYGDGTSGNFNWTSLGNLNYQGVDDMTVGGLSCDGSFAVFQKYRTIYLDDLRNGTVTSVSVGSDTSTSPIISCNGRYVLYATQNRTDIAPTPTGMDSYLHLVRYDRLTGERQYIDSNSSNVFSTNHFSYSGSYAFENVFNASIADTGDVVFKYNGNTYLKHLSDNSGTLESIAKTASGSYINVTNGTLTSDGRYIFFSTDPYNLGLAPSPSTNQIIRTRTGL